MINNPLEQEALENRASVHVNETDQLALRITEPVSARMAAFESTLRGAGGDALRLWKDLSSTASVLPGTGRAAADKIASLRKDTSVPVEHRQKMTSETRLIADQVVTAAHKSMTATASALEAELIAGLRPKPHRDYGARELARQEVEMRVGRKQGGDLLDAATKAIGRDPAHDAELLSSYGRALFERNGAGEHYEVFEKAALAKLLETKGTTEKQEASRLALKAFRDLKIGGVPAAFQQAALLHLRRDN